MRAIGPEPPTDKALREWFEEQEKHNLDQLEGGAKTIIQLVTGLYGLLFTILAFSAHPTPEYLRRDIVIRFGTAATVAFFLALLAALLTVYPFHNSYRTDNLTDMDATYLRITRRKLWGLRIALLAFLAGALCLGGLIIAILWRH